MARFEARDKAVYDGRVQHRNHLIDLARIGAMLIVVLFHSLLWQTSVEAGQIRVVPWAPGPVWWAISWVATCIPVFFVAAGYANAVLVDKWLSEKQSYADFLTHRGSRMLGPMSFFGICFILFSSIPAWLGWTAAASQYSRLFAQLLWFAVVYQLLLAAAPLAVRLHDRHGWRVMVPFLVGTVVIDAWTRLSGDLSVQWLNLAMVWPLAHQLGIAYHRGWFRQWPIGRLLALLLGSVGLIAVLIFGLGYPAAAVAWADILVANLLPPTLAILLLGIVQTCFLALLEKAGVARELPPKLADLVRVANAMVLTTYLWHIVAIVAGTALLLGLGLWLLPGQDFQVNPALLCIIVLIILIGTVPQLARIDLRLMPRPGPGHRPAWFAWLGYASFAAGTWAVWQCGAVLHPADPAALAAVGLAVVGTLLLRRATTS